MTSFGVKWKVHMAVSSNEVRSLNAPLVAMSLTTTNEKGQKETKVVEMKLEQFRSMLSSLEEIQTEMENAKLVH